MSPKISIITATKNAASTITSTLDSVLAQEFCDIEHIIIDGASTDNTLEIIKRYRAPYKCQHKILRYYSKSDAGIYDGMNKGLQYARGEIIGFLNADDFYTHSKVLSFIIWAFAKPNGIMACYGNVLYVNSALAPLRMLKGAPFSHIGFKLGAHPPHPSFYALKTLYIRYGGFDTRYHIAADYELMLRLLYKYHAKSLYIDEHLVTMRIGGESNKSLRHIVLANMECARAWRELKLSAFPAFIPLKPLRKLIDRLLMIMGGGGAKLNLSDMGICDICIINAIATLHNANTYPILSFLARFFINAPTLLTFIAAYTLDSYTSILARFFVAIFFHARYCITYAYINVSRYTTSTQENHPIKQDLYKQYKTFHINEYTHIQSIHKTHLYMHHDKKQETRAKFSHKHKSLTPIHAYFSHNSTSLAYIKQRHVA